MHARTRGATRKRAAAEVYIYRRRASKSLKSEGSPLARAKARERAKRDCPSIMSPAGKKARRQRRCCTHIRKRNSASRKYSARIRRRGGEGSSGPGYIYSVYI